MEEFLQENQSIKNAGAYGYFKHLEMIKEKIDH
jgi:hypothetical protein